MDIDEHHSGAPTDIAVAPTGSSRACMIPKRTRSQLTAPNDTSLVSLARSPLKDARARARARTMATSSQTLAHRSRRGEELDLASEEAESESRRGSVQKVEVMQAAQEHTERPEGGGHDGDTSMSMDIRGSRNDGDPRHVGPTGAKKRASPDITPLTSPSAERDPKRAKLEAMKALSKTEVASTAMEYEVPLSDDGATSPRRSRIRASSVVPPSRSALLFPSRAKSVPLESESVLLPVDLTAVPPSPRRSPKKVIEIRRAPSQPPPDQALMDVDAEPSPLDFSHFTNVAPFPSPRALPTYNYTVNFATPLTASKRTLIPMSPLTPLPPTPFVPNMTRSLVQVSLSAMKLDILFHF